MSLQSTLYNSRRSLKNTFYFHCILLKILREMKPPVIIWPWLLSLDLLMPLTHDPVKHSAFIFKHSLFRDIFSRPRAYACLTAPVCLLGRVTAALTCLSHTTRTLTAPWWTSGRPEGMLAAVDYTLATGCAHIFAETVVYYLRRIRVRRDTLRLTVSWHAVSNIGDSTLYAFSYMKFCWRPKINLKTGNTVILWYSR